MPRGFVKQSRTIGCTDLLKTRPRKALRVSRKASAHDIEALLAEISQFSGVVWSTFFSPGERACRDALLVSTAKIIWLAPMALPARIPEAWTDAFLSQRALWLSPFEEPDATRSNCMQANRWLESFCSEE